MIRYDLGGHVGLSNRVGDGRPRRLTEGQQAALKAIVLIGPNSEADGVSTAPLFDLCRIVRKRFGVDYDESGLGKLLHRLGPAQVRR